MHLRALPPPWSFLSVDCSTLLRSQSCAKMSLHFGDHDRPSTVCLDDLLALAGASDVRGGAAVGKLLRGLLGGLGGASSLLVGSPVEGDEEEEVRRQDEGTEQSSTFTASAVGVDQSWQEWEVSVDKVLVGGKVDDANVDDELGDLQSREIFLPPEPGTTSGSVVVVVHDDVNEQVECDDDPLHRGLSVELGVAQNGSGCVVEDVKESKGLLLEDKEDSVDELDVLDVVVDHVVGDETWGERGRVADGPVETMFEVKRDNLLEHEKEEETRDGGEEEVVDLEQRSELVRWSRSHNLPSAKDNQEVCANGSHDGLVGAERTASGNPCPVLDRRRVEPQAVPCRRDGSVQWSRSGRPSFERVHLAAFFQVLFDGGSFCADFRSGRLWKGRGQDTCLVVNERVWDVAARLTLCERC